LLILYNNIGHKCTIIDIINTTHNKYIGAT
jgi:hypothetical protein